MPKHECRRALSSDFVIRNLVIPSEFVIHHSSFLVKFRSFSCCRSKAQGWNLSPKGYTASINSTRQNDRRNGASTAQWREPVRG